MIFVIPFFRGFYRAENRSCIKQTPAKISERTVLESFGGKGEGCAFEKHKNIGVLFLFSCDPRETDHTIL